MASSKNRRRNVDVTFTIPFLLILVVVISFSPTLVSAQEHKHNDRNDVKYFSTDVNAMGAERHHNGHMRNFQDNVTPIPSAIIPAAASPTIAPIMVETDIPTIAPKTMQPSIGATNRPTNAIPVTTIPTISPTEQPTSIAPTAEYKSGSDQEKIFAFALSIGMFVLVIGTCITHRAYVYYALREVAYTFMKYGCTRWMGRACCCLKKEGKTMSKPEEQQGSLNTIIFDDPHGNGALNEALL
mmetsp:Transcript_36618/g.44211  ORF Transcript_36618/g.44211 Transcript_36618/m.44211 type:complete len:241 (+) Transcript_36618:100-822(+)|eukprot:CAMPEP_0194378906 /NCGR_PEP_ID=MMETSP0174-20130528/37180_1 /TAXON_ID=216777 /ORGANISM="Proboscia alata, Strain PI-D3" /LENGTH=240 /DNA_ID=CAMNT_0039161235 /DNA_START=58 /DNA_END=780 /DNA_ORIENTATION=+